MAAQKYWIRLGIVAIVLMVSWAVYVSSKQIARNERIEDEVTLLKREADKIRRENENLSQKIGYFSSPDFREQEAKEKLGMKKEDEEALVIRQRPEAVGTTDMTPIFQTAPAVVPRDIPNYRKWWQLFFGRG